jgi:hypothetical protein
VANPAFIQSTISADPSGGTIVSSLSVAYTTQNLSAGSFLAAFVTVGITGLTLTVSDSVNGSWTKGVEFDATTNQQSAAWYSFVNSAGGSKPTVTLSPLLAAVRRPPDRGVRSC